MSYDDDMQNSVDDLKAEVIGHKIINVEKNVRIPGNEYWRMPGTEITLDNGKRVYLIDSEDCCAYTELDKFLFNADLAEHIITNVETEDSYSTWHILADMAEVLSLDVGWSEGSGYYSYGFTIEVEG